MFTVMWNKLENTDSVYEEERLFLLFQISDSAMTFHVLILIQFLMDLKIPVQIISFNTICSGIHFIPIFSICQNLFVLLYFK